MYKSYIPNEKLIFPPDLCELVPEDAPVRLISDIVDLLDLTEIHESYSKSKEGQPAYHPAMLLKAVIFGYMNNIFSTRGLETVMSRDAHYIWLSSYQFPDHSTISRFKTRCMPYIKVIFARLVQILVERGEVELTKDLYIDGTTIRSRAARRRIKWRRNAEKYSDMADEEIQANIKILLEQAEHGDADDTETNTHVTYTTDEAREIANSIEKKLKEEGKNKKNGKITAIRNACDRKDVHDKIKEQCGGRCGVAPTDPECGIMHAKEDGYEGRPSPNYNIQAATQQQYVTNYEAYNSPEDKCNAIRFVDTCIEENGVKPSAVVADAGYGCEEVYTGLEQRGIEAVVKYPHYEAESTRRPVKEGKYDKHGFKLSEDETNLVCPGGHLMRILRTEVSYTRLGFCSDVTIFTCDHCSDCPFKKVCALTTSKNKEIRRKMGNLREERKAKARLDKPENQVKLKRRSLEPEPVFGQLKYNHGYTRFRHFGKAKVTMDLGFVFMALNLLKLYRNTQKSL